ncbi:MAG TPA: hypothetical protein VFH88_00190 [Candidatus Krumholzibacteria bacterium]|nr:hypothetical protein [Candidatus Krumholzibacteria bacterium]
MRRAVLWLALIAICVAVVPASAQFGTEEQEVKYLQVPHRFQIFVDGGIALPSLPGLFKDYWNTAFNFGMGFGVVVFPWLEVNGTLNSISFNNNDIKSKSKLGYQGVKGLEGGAIHTRMFYGSARFIAVPHARTNPYVEIGVGGFKTKADDLSIENVVQNSMENVSGICVVPSVGIQYAMNERWSAYSKVTYAVNLNSDFAPGDLLIPVGSTQKTIGGNQVISSIVVGVMIKF